MKKRLLALLLATILAFTLVACPSGGRDRGGIEKIESDTDPPSFLYGFQTVSILFLLPHYRNWFISGGRLFQRGSA